VIRTAVPDRGSPGTIERGKRRGTNQEQNLFNHGEEKKAVALTKKKKEGEKGGGAGPSEKGGDHSFEKGGPPPHGRGSESEEGEDVALKEKGPLLQKKT